MTELALTYRFWAFGQIIIATALMAFRYAGLARRRARLFGWSPVFRSARFRADLGATVAALGFFGEHANYLMRGFVIGQHVVDVWALAGMTCALVGASGLALWMHGEDDGAGAWRPIAWTSLLWLILAPIATASAPGLIIVTLPWVVAVLTMMDRLGKKA